MRHNVNKPVKTLKTPKVNNMPRRTVQIYDTVEDWFQRARGQLMMLRGVDLDNTKAHNLFLALGAWRLSTGFNLAQLTDSENKLIDFFCELSKSIDPESVIDELATWSMREVERTAKAGATKK